MPIDFGANHEHLWMDEFVNREKIEHLAVSARAALGALTDAIEDELEDAVDDVDAPRVAKIAWSYGLLTASITQLETYLIHE